MSSCQRAVIAFLFVTTASRCSCLPIDLLICMLISLIRCAEKSFYASILSVANENQLYQVSTMSYIASPRLLHPASRTQKSLEFMDLFHRSVPSRRLPITCIGTRTPISRLTRPRSSWLFPPLLNFAHCATGDLRKPEPSCVLPACRSVPHRGGLISQDTQSRDLASRATTLRSTGFSLVSIYQR